MWNGLDTTEVSFSFTEHPNSGLLSMTLQNRNPSSLHQWLCHLEQESLEAEKAREECVGGLLGDSGSNSHHSNSCSVGKSLFKMATFNCREGW